MLALRTRRDLLVVPVGVGVVVMGRVGSAGGMRLPSKAAWGPLTGVHAADLGVHPCMAPGVGLHARDRGTALPGFCVSAPLAPTGSCDSMSRLCHGDGPRLCGDSTGDDNTACTSSGTLIGPMPAWLGGSMHALPVDARVA